MNCPHDSDVAETVSAAPVVALETAMVLLATSSLAAIKKAL